MELSSFYRMYCGVQKYAWGMNQKDPRCFVYRLHSSGHVNQQLQQNAENIHFAELWMGNHISLPSLTKENKQIPKQLPFLFKVLSIDQPLSIQLHPNKQQAEYLHLQFPNHYPDNNHKPELAIALDCFEGMIGFAPKQLIINNFERNQSIIRLLGEIIWNQFINSDASNEQILLKQITTKILALNEQEISEVLTNYQYPIECCASLKEIKLYNDVGFIFVLMMNHVTLQTGECLLMKAGLIHAYLKGNCIEAMANSDNVVRCGFTPKFKDIQIMNEIISCEMMTPTFIQPTIEKNEDYILKEYVTNYQEFQCSQLQLYKGKEKKINIKKPTIILCVSGIGFINNEQLDCGYTFYCDNIEITLKAENDVEIYLCSTQI